MSIEINLMHGSIKYAIQFKANDVSSGIAELYWLTKDAEGKLTCERVGYDYHVPMNVVDLEDYESAFPYMDDVWNGLQVFSNVSNAREFKTVWIQEIPATKWVWVS